MSSALPSMLLDTLAELRRRRPTSAASKRHEGSAAAESLRAWMYPKQRAFFAPSGSLLRSVRKARRAGITSGGCRELMARGLEIPGFRAIYMATTRDEAIARAWLSDTKSGVLDLLQALATPLKHRTLTAYTLGGVSIEVREVDLELNFSNGSQIKLIGADNIKTYDRKRGGAKHVWWIDEAQNFVELEACFDSVVIPSLSDFVGEAWVTGTPGRDCTGMFYDITKEPDEDEEPLAGWDVHELFSTDNPFFGRVVEAQDTTGAITYYVTDNTTATTGFRLGPYDDAATAETAAVANRWDRTAGASLTARGWTGTEPDFLREWRGKWVKEDARYVYPVHAVPSHVLLFAPPRLRDNPFVGTHPRFKGHGPWYDHTMAMRDLPRPGRHQAAYQWLFAIGADFGFHPDPFALIVWAFCFQLPDIYEMFSWKQTRVHTDDQGQYMRLLWDTLPNVVSFVGDPANKQDDFEVWKTRMNMPIEEANKRGKNVLEEFLADDIRRGHVHLRTGSALHTEMKHLVYLPTKPGKTREVNKHRKVNGIVHGDHCCDGARYSYTDLQHYLSKRPADKPEPGTREAYEAEAEREQRQIEDIETRRAREMAERDEQATDWRYGSEGYQWQ